MKKDLVLRGVLLCRTNSRLYMNRSVEALLSLRCREVPVLKLEKRKPVSRNLRYTFLDCFFFFSPHDLSFVTLLSSLHYH